MQAVEDQAISSAIARIKEEAKSPAEFRGRLVAWMRSRKSGAPMNDYQWQSPMEPLATLNMEDQVAP